MRNFILTILIISFLLALVFSLTGNPSLDGNNYFVSSFFLTFGFLLIPVFLSTCLLYLIKAIFKRTHISSSLPLQMTIMFLIIMTLTFVIYIPDYLRHHKEPGYIPYNSMTEYFTNQILEPLLMTIVYSITIPITNRILERKLVTKKESNTLT